MDGDVRQRAIESGDPEAWHRLALRAGRDGDSSLALVLIDRAIERDPECARYHAERGTVLARLERSGEALAAYDEALRLRPDFAQVHFNRGNCLRRMGHQPEALDAYDEALRLRPDFAEAQVNRGIVLKEMGRHGEALGAYDEGLRLRPNLTELHLNRGHLLVRMGRLGEALAAYDEALRLRPDYAEAHSDRGNALMGMARHAEAVGAYQEALRLRPDYAEAYSNYLFCLNYDPGVDNAALFEAHRRWGERFGQCQRALAVHRNSPDPDRALRIGLVSPDLGRHPIGYFTESTLANLDRAQVILLCYSGRQNEDEITARIKESASVWRSTNGLSDRELAETVLADEVDILIDLAGHTAASRVSCFALRPAPVLVHWGGSTHTIPLGDYSLWDWIHVPAGDERWFVETVIRLPDVRMCYTPPRYAPEVSAPPMLTQGRVTFGGFNNLAKLNAGVVEVWARVLTAVPGSRLMLNWRTLEDARERERIAACFGACGIGPERLDLRSGEPTHAGVLGEYSELDIALDTFPFSGCTTTCEALWMGVPVVTLPQTRPVSRQSQAFLTALGATEWIASDTDAFVRIASQLAADPNRLTLLRQEQRRRMHASPVCDASRFARSFEAALRGTWRNWCEEARRVFSC